MTRRTTDDEWLDAISAYRTTYGCYPGLRELGRLMKRSTTSAHYRLHSLGKKSLVFFCSCRFHHIVAIRLLRNP